jgi:hypothetical protein
VFVNYAEQRFEFAFAKTREEWILFGLHITE